MTLRPASAEFESVAFTDKRLSKRLGLLADQIAARSDRGLPGAAGDEAALEGAYRFLNNPRVDPHTILEPHFEETRRRVALLKRVLVVHDTTQFSFDGRGFGPLRGEKGGEGFYLHTALALADAVGREPLGVLGAGTFERRAKPRGAKKAARDLSVENELDYWKFLFADVHQRLDGIGVVHVMDRQADAYDLFAGICGQSDFVIRAAHDRLVLMEESRQKLSSAIAEVEAELFREVSIAARDKDGWNARRHHPARQSRRARLSIRARSVILRQPQTSRAAGVPPELPLNVVQVIELDPPIGEVPVEWMLFTTLPISSAEEIAAVVDIYRARWVIEELFKAIKTGCAYEKRQLESPEALLNMLAVTLPVAWRLLLMRHLAQEEPTAPAARALPQSQIDVLSSVDRKLPPQPTVHDVLMAVARLGGHLKRNGAPGWQLLTAGYRELLLLERGWLAARQAL